MKRLIALLLATVFVLGGIIPVSAAGSDGGSYTPPTLSGALTTSSYASYLSKNPADRATSTVVINAVDYDSEKTTADVQVFKEYAGENGEFLQAGDAGKVVWTVDVPESGLYALDIRYNSVTSKTNTIERSLYVNGKVPFTEARYLTLPKTWVNDYNEENGRFVTDAGGNELRPNASVVHRWSVYQFRDSNGYVSSPLQIYLEKGENTIALEAVREPVMLDTLTLHPLETLKSYADVKAEYDKLGYKPATGATPIMLEAELPTAVSNFTIYPINDRSSAITSPQHATQLLLNSIGGAKWSSAGTWVEYEFVCEKTGLYNIVTRFRQSYMDGMYNSRRVYINGEVPFEEANMCQFGYAEGWQVDELSYHYGSGANDYYDFEFYFEEGKTYTIRFEVTVGYLGAIVEKLSNARDSLNEDYLEILRLTGPTPDENRTYGFARVMPDTIIDLYNQSEVIGEVIDYLVSMGGVKGETISTLEQIQILLRKMGSDESQIAANLANFKTELGNLSSWISSLNSQAINLDYLVIQPAGEALPKADANFFETLLYQIQQFFGSFFTDYNNVGASGDGENSGTQVNFWIETGRDQAQIIRNLVDNSYRKDNPNSNVEIKLVASGTLLPSVLAGVGPDLSLSGVGNAGATGIGQVTNVINYAIRGAVLPLNGYEGFDEVTKRFSEAAINSLSLYGVTYALPDTQSFPVMFYRTDILSDLGVEVPKTWDELLALIPILQYNNMTMGVRMDDYQTYMYQMGGNMWADDGMRINLDSNTALEAVEMACNMFTQFSLLADYNVANQFRTGEMPIAIADYTIYNNIIAFATEIAGLWSFSPIPGTVQEDGTINNSAVSYAAGMTMMKGCQDEAAAWHFMSWYTDKYFQVNFSNELVAVLGDCAKNPTANIEALEELDWTSTEYAALSEQFKNLVYVDPYPGNYIIDRYINFVFADTYTKFLDPVDSMLSYISAINAEITRKRVEFGLETLEAGQTLAQKRMSQANTAMDELEDRGKKNDAAFAAAAAAIEDNDIAALKEASEMFSDLIGDKKLDVDITKQTLSQRDGGYDIDDLSDDELIYFISVALSDASYRLTTYIEE